MLGVIGLIVVALLTVAIACSILASLEAGGQFDRELEKDFDELKRQKRLEKYYN